MSRLTVAAALASVLASCASPPSAPGGPATGGSAPAPRDGRAPIEIAPHALEVLRLPHPAFHPDGVLVTGLSEDSAWARAGIRAGDVIERVNGIEVRSGEDFRRACGGLDPPRVRLVRSRVRTPAPTLSLLPAHAAAGSPEVVRLPTLLPAPAPCPCRCRCRIVEIEVGGAGNPRGRRRTPGPSSREAP